GGLRGQGRLVGARGPPSGYAYLADLYSPDVPSSAAHSESARIPRAAGGVPVGQAFQPDPLRRRQAGKPDLQKPPSRSQRTMKTGLAIPSASPLSPSPLA